MGMRKSPFPPEIERLLSVVGRKLELGKKPGLELPELIAALSDFPADAVRRAAPHLANSARLFISGDARSWLERLLGRTPTDDWRATHVPGMEYLLLFHFDGRLREKALKKIDGGLESPFWFGAICLRLNDWAEPVRKAAFLCAERCFPYTAAEVIADGAVSLVLAQSAWGRWHVERKVVDVALSRSDVVDQIANLICKKSTGPVSKVLRLLMKNSAIDVHLPRLATDARQPAVRAMAVQTIADMTAAWPNGWEWKWIDKSMGQRTMVQKFDKREIDIELDRLDVICTAAADNAAIVRRAALDAMIQHYPSSKRAAQLAHQLKNDKNYTVRARAAFFISNVLKRGTLPSFAAEE
jgi:hypothetical protein